MPPRIRAPLDTFVVVAGAIYPLTDRMTVGRRGFSMQPDIDVAHALVNIFHCILEVRPDGLWVEDHSDLGTMLNGRRALREPLHVGDVLTLGVTPLSFHHLLPPHPGRGADETALIADVLAAPDDDAPRLVYADWLMDRGDPRGAFIRYQLAGRDDLAAPLLAEHELAWAAPLPVPVHSWTFRRGFLAEAVAPEPARALAALRRHHPIERVTAAGGG